MRRLDVQIPAPDGHSDGTLHVPEEDGPWPGVLVFPDAGGARETFRQMGDRLAAELLSALSGRLTSSRSNSAVTRATPRRRSMSAARTAASSSGPWPATATLPFPLSSTSGRSGPAGGRVRAAASRVGVLGCCRGGSEHERGGGAGIADAQGDDGGPDQEDAADQ
jgi:hypothetical protein